MLTTGPNLGALINGAYSEEYYAELMHLLRSLDLLTQPHVISATLTVPPVAPVEGDAYIVPAAATGVWSGKTNQIARWTEYTTTPQWEFFTPKKNWNFGVDDLGATGRSMRFNGVTWVDEIGDILSRLTALEAV